MNRKHLEELLYQALETEMGGVLVYRSAVECARNEDLRKEWEKYGEQTKRHVSVLRDVFDAFGLDPEKQTAGRKIVREKAKTLIAAMDAARKNAPDAAQIVAAECVVDAETKDHLNWELLGEVARKLTGREREALAAAHAEIENQEDEHLYHTMGWTRELWMDALGLRAVLPPPEERKDVKTAVGAARAKAQRTQMAPAKSAKSARKSR
jgi:rubrerythrin